MESEDTTTTTTDTGKESPIAVTDKEDNKEEERWCIPASGVDAGIVNLGMGGLKFYGTTELVDEMGVKLETLPDFEITGGERWDVTRGIVYRPAPNMFDLEAFVPSPPAIYSNKMKHITDQIAQCVPRAKWLFEAAPSLLEKGERRLPILFVENQSDFVQRDAAPDANGRQPTDFKKAIMGQVANAVSNTVNAVDAAQNDGKMPRRERCGAMAKAGQRCDGSRVRAERKEQEVHYILDLLCKLGTPNALAWLGWFKNMLATGEQIHDIIDAISLALAGCMKKYESHGKAEIRVLQQKTRAEIKARRELLKSLPKAPMRRKPAAKKKVGASVIDNGEQPSDEEAKKPKKAVAPRKPRAKKADKKESSDGNEEEKEKPKPKKPRKKKAKKSESSDEEAPKKSKKKATDKKEKKAKKSNKEKKDKEENKKKRKRKISSESSDEDDDVEIIDEPRKKKGREAVELVYPLLLADEPLHS